MVQTGFSAGDANFEASAFREIVRPRQLFGAPLQLVERAGVESSESQDDPTCRPQPEVGKVDPIEVAIERDSACLLSSLDAKGLELAGSDRLEPRGGSGEQLE